MKTITKSEDCLKCRECCRLEKVDLYFSPLFTDKELEKIKEKIGNVDCFIDYKESGKVFQIKMVKSRKEDVYVCPFLNEDEHKCKIYNIRPFDCKMWPFMLARVNDRVYIVCFDKCLCRSLEAAPYKELEAYKKHIIELFESEEYRSLIKKYPELIWDYDPDTFEIAEIKI